MMDINRREFLTGAVSVGAASILSGHDKLIRAAQSLKPTFLPTILRDAGASNLNFITVMCDSLRYDHIGFLGNDWIQTPNIDAFASQSQVFDAAYMGGFPTLLNRAEFFTGRYMYTIMGWENLPGDAVVMADVLNQSDYTTGLVFDTWHFKDNGYFLDRGFQSWDWVRGQEGDRFRAQPREMPLPASPEKFRSVETLQQYLRNTAGRQNEADYAIAQTIHRAVAWLEQNMSYGPFYLHVDCFDPHEPWDPPQAYVDLYNPGYVGEQVIYPAYAPPDYLSAAELNHMRALYAAKVTQVDHWLGHFWSELSRLELDNNTVVILFSDHGLLLGEHQAIGKAWSHGGYYEAYPLYQELAHIPLMIRVPGQPPRRSQALAQPADIMPTILDLANADDPGTMHGKSLRSLLEGSNVPVQTTAVASRSLLASLSTKARITVTDGVWTLLHGAAHTSSHLYHLHSDPHQMNDLLAQECAQAQALHSQLIDLLHYVNTPPAYVANWLPSPC
jgi:arylsulfatase A-like enzyme